MGWSRRIVVLGAVVPLLGGVAQPVGAAPPSGAAPAGAARSAGGEHTVTLVTGDRVTVRKAGKRYAVRVTPGRGRERIGFVQTQQRGRVQVVPRDALRLLADGRLDGRLFDVTMLIGFNYDDAGRSDLPLIVQGPRAARARLATGRSLVTKELPAIGAAAVRGDKRGAGQLWTKLAGGGESPRTLASGLTKVWLDGVARPMLNESVPKIGAPAAWRSGLTGKGVTVGVLDTGIDATHADLNDAVAQARDFTGGSNPQDVVGHGTHVASTITGSGAASNKSYQGVAPDARLLVGKVCGADGQCPESAIVEGMTWTAEAGARVINLSIGGCPSDGTDPLSSVVDSLTERTGALFVASAGNLNQPPDCQPDRVSAPAAADSALAVASVDKADVVSAFSRTGPRWGDYALKPDISAPGQTIVAALAKETEFGVPVGKHYTRASGTSMAAPHVAGAAAILAQRHPTWRAPQLKAALMNSAHRVLDTGVYAQGAGRVDVARAVTQQVRASPANLSMGMVEWRGQPVTKTLTYTNSGSTPVTLRLSLDMRGADGQPAPEGLFAVSPSEVTVPAGEQAKVSATVTPRATPEIRSFGGWLTATGADTTVRTPVGVTTEPERFNLTVEPVNRFGALADDAVSHVVNLDTGEWFHDFPSGGRITMRLPKGRYHVNVFIASDEPGGTYQENPTMAADPEVVLDDDRTLRFDARQGKKVTMDVGNRDAAFASMTMGFERTTKQNVYAVEWPFEDPNTAYVVPSKSVAPATDFRVGLYALLAKRGADDGFASSPFTYSLVFGHDGSLPPNPNWRLTRRDLARVDARYGAVAPEKVGAALATPIFADRAFWPFAPGLFADLPYRRTEYYNHHPGMFWAKEFLQYPADPNQPKDYDLFDERSYRPGRTYAEPWNLAVFGPGFQTSGRPDPVITRTGDEISVFLPQLFNDQSPTHYTKPFDDPSVTGKAELFRNGTKVGEVSGTLMAWFDVPPEPGNYRLTITAERVPQSSSLSNRVQVSWQFRSAHVSGEEQRRLPVSAVRFAPRVNDHNLAPAGRLFTVPIYVQHQTTDPVPSDPKLTATVSYDDGATWRPVWLVRTSRGRWIALLNHPARRGFVSLKVRATAFGGTALEQTIIRAYRIG